MNIILPSSRTPEGEPLRCSMCGALHCVDVSRPPGDSVCPSCGAHVWVPHGFVQGEATKAQIQSFVEQLLALCRSDRPIDEIGKFLVLGLTRCLAAYGAMLWLESKRNSLFTRRTFDIVACIGEPDLPLLARIVAATKREIVREAIIADRVTLAICVPVICNERVVGVIEVLQRAGSPLATTQGYLRFVSQMADIVAGASGLAT